MQIGYLRLWTTDADPWDQADTGAQLGQFVTYWNANMGEVPRHLAHFLSGRGLGGGVAYVGVVCNSTYGYGLSANLGGSFPLPIQNNHGSNWDLMVTDHEIGHNFGASHTHDLVPPVDNCAGGDGVSSARNTRAGGIMHLARSVIARPDYFGGASCPVRPLGCSCLESRF